MEYTAITFAQHNDLPIEPEKHLKACHKSLSEDLIWEMKWYSLLVTLGRVHLLLISKSAQLIQIIYYHDGTFENNVYILVLILGFYSK